MSNFKLEFTLKQHTPIIHFQSNQAGATLRATELKPKFDKFLKEYAFGGNIPNDYKVAKDKDALDYKVKIINSSVNEISTPKAYVNTKKERDKAAYQAPYFAGEHKSILSKNIKIEFFSFNKELLEIIKKYVNNFFTYENFGTRQNKGFGSFSRNNITDQEIKNILLEHNNPVFILDRYSDYKDAFKKIDLFYKKIKSGLNRPYHKSELFTYCCNNYNIGWEKKAIKNNFPQVIHGEHSPIVCNKPDDREFKYIRAVLGLAEHNEYRPPEGKKQVKIKSTSDIERFKSPITFKPINGTIYVLFNNSYQDILNKEFKFFLDGSSFTLNTPSEFDMYSFFQYLQNNELLQKEVTR